MIMSGSHIACGLCPHLCRLAPGETGRCRVRRNVSGKVESTVYGLPCAVHLDPVEKKPFYHVTPGCDILSIGMPGCNLRCAACQNASISQSGATDRCRRLAPRDVPELARGGAAGWIAYTYTEPLVAHEYVRDCASAARDAGLRNAMVTAAYVNAAPLTKLLPLIDAANVDLKAFSNDFYRAVCGATLPPVLRALRAMRDAGVHLEITHLVIPTLNDSDRQFDLLSRWIVKNLGAEIPLHLSRFFPAWRLAHLPCTPPETLSRAVRIASGNGLRHVYTGNVVDDENAATRCAECRAPLLIRNGWKLVENRLNNGCCPSCKTPLYGIWK